ncbi:MAG TPA: copper homeostasis protein CutC [Cyclobacteriaceae bacterium]
MKLEIVVYNIESAVNAQRGGADRIELCDNPTEGGTTPSAGVIELVRKKLAIEVYVMIRPRGGDFCYSDDEFTAMKIDIERCKQIGVDGVVFGIVNKDGVIDRKRCSEVVSLSRPMKVTCHRAFDVTRDPFQALDDCINSGFDRILTSGQKRSAAEGSDLIRDLVQRAEGRISIMPGSGVSETNIEALVKETQVKEVHFSARKFKASEVQKLNEDVRFTDPLPDHTGSWVTDPDVIKRIRKVIG